MAYNPEMIEYIRQAAAVRKLNPDIVLRVAGAEGGLSDPFRRGQGPAPKSQASGFGSTENSFGPFQLYISGKNAGLGDRALAAGIDPRKDWKGGIDFALDEVARKGWGQWYGAAKAGVGKWDGVRGASPVGVTANPNAVAYNPSPVPTYAGNNVADDASQSAPVADAPQADPFSGLMSIFMNQMAQQAAQKQAAARAPVPMTAPEEPQQEQSAYDQLAMTSQTPNAYYKRRRANA